MGHEKYSTLKNGTGKNLPEKEPPGKYGPEKNATVKNGTGKKGIRRYHKVWPGGKNSIQKY